MGGTPNQFQTDRAAPFASLSMTTPFIRDRFNTFRKNGAMRLIRFFATSSGVPRYHFAAIGASFRTHIDDVISLRDHTEIVFDYDHGVALIDEAMEDGEEQFDVRHV